MHVILAFGSRRLDQFEVFMSPRATVNSQLVYATDGDVTKLCSRDKQLAKCQVHLRMAWAIDSREGGALDGSVS